MVLIKVSHAYRKMDLNMYDLIYFHEKNASVKQAPR